LSGAPERERRIAVMALAGAVAACVWLFATARIALRVLTSSLPPAAAGAVLGLSLALLTAALVAIVIGAARVLEKTRRRIPSPGAALVMGCAVILLFVTVAIVTGTTSGAGGDLAIFGVMKRPELDLRAVGILIAIAAAGYCLPALVTRVPLAAVAGVALLPLLLLWKASAADISRRTSLGIERGGALSKGLLSGFRRITDGDRDGYSLRFGGGDCNDGDARVNPGADDVPGNGRDEDCSGKDDRPSTLAAGGAAELTASRPEVADKLPEKLNVVLITVDTLRYDLGYMGNPRPLSRNLDALAKRAAVFERAYALASYTSKSLPPMMIGKFTSETHRGWAHFNRFGREDTFVQERLQKAGVRTISVQGYWYFFQKGYGFERGFDVIDSSAAPAVAQVEGDRSFNGHKVSDAAIAQLSNPENTNRQFFLWAHYVDPHSEYAKHSEFDFGPSSRDLYDGEVAFVDQQVGRVLEHIAKSPYAERTAVVFTSDHGEAFGEHGMIRHGFEVWEELVRVPLLVFVPGAEPRRVAVPRSTVDVAPTILDLYRLEKPRGEGGDFLSGQSLLPEVLSPTYEPKPRPVLVDMSAGPHNAERQAFVDGGMKLIATGGRPLGLYDLKNDPGEKKDLLDDEALKSDVLARYKAFRRGLKEVVVRPQ
jgi:arylsulfatase A-like enzyme